MNKIKEEASPKNASKQKACSVNIIPSLSNFNEKYLEENIKFISPLTHEFSDVPNLDRHHEFVDYFPYNNIDKIMKQLSDMQEKIEQKRKKKKSEN